MKVAIVQLGLANAERPDERLNHMFRLIERHSDADLIVLPELWKTGFCSFDRYVATAETESGELAQSMSKLASKCDAYLHAGSMVEQDGDRLYSTSLFFDRNGALLAKYRKIHLFGYQSREPEILSHGRDVLVISTDLGKIGLSTCYDLRFPELYRRQLDQGAHIFLIVAAWPRSRIDDWLLLVRARALENLGYIIAANCAGEDRECTYAGHSCIVDPYGQIVAQGSSGEAIVSAEIDLDCVQTRRSSFPAIDDRVLGTERKV